MGRIVIACFRPRAGKADELLEVVKDHMPVLRGEDLITNREPIVMRAEDGTIIEVFEWRSEEAIRKAHESPRVHALWKRYEAACEYVTMSDVPESKEMFSNFEPIDVER